MGNHDIGERNFCYLKHARLRPIIQMEAELENEMVLRYKEKDFMFPQSLSKETWVASTPHIRITFLKPKVILEDTAKKY